MAFALVNFVWKESANEDAIVQTPFGFYTVRRTSHPNPLRPTKRLYRYRWGYCFTEFYDEKEMPCESLAHGKRLAWENWKERLSGAVVELKDGEW